MAYEITEIKKIGIGLIGFGLFFTFLGIILFFDRGLLALGNIFSLAGVAILLGWRSTWALFTNRANFKGSASFFLGLFFIFVRWPIVGIILEIYSCVFLFSGFWSSIKVFLYHILVVGWIIQFISLAILQYIKLLVLLGIDHYVLLSKIDDYSVAGSDSGVIKVSNQSPVPTRDDSCDKQDCDEGLP